METKYKLYPYPVLSSWSNDYKAGSFSSQIDLVKDGYERRAEMHSVLDCPSLAELIKEGKAEYVYHLECTQTGFRRVIMTDKEYKTFVLQDKDVNVNLQICPFIAAVQDIKGYTSGDFHEDYQGLSFDIEAGCILAADNPCSFSIVKRKEDLEDLPSIFDVYPNEDEQHAQMTVGMNSDTIIILLQPNAFYQYKQLMMSPQNLNLLNSLITFPALVYVLDELKSMSAYDREDNYSGKLWYKTLSSALEKNFGFSLENGDFSPPNTTVELAQKLIGNPIVKAFDLLAGICSASGDDEE